MIMPPYTSKFSEVFHHLSPLIDISQSSGKDETDIGGVDP